MSNTITEKLEWLRETCTEEFVNSELVNQMARWMGQDDFNEFYDHLCRNYEIARDAEELDEIMNG